MMKTTILVFTILIYSASLLAQTTNTNPDLARIVTSDIELFWKAFDKATPENNLYVFRDEYLREGSIGLTEFARLRIGNSCDLVGTIEAAPKYYAALRSHSLKIPSFENQMRNAFKKLNEIYPTAVFPDIYFVVGSMNSAGTLSKKGLFIGVDMFGKNEGAPIDELSNWQKANISSTKRLPVVVAHELIHYQQKYESNNSLLASAINEGSADFVGELISGENSNPHLHKYGNPLEKELWFEFKKEMNGRNINNWLYQGDKATTRPADLGYFIGYKICESYYKNAKDKKQAVKEILEIKDFQKFLTDSLYEAKFN